MTVFTSTGLLRTYGIVNRLIAGPRPTIGDRIVHHAVVHEDREAV